MKNSIFVLLMIMSVHVFAESMSKSCNGTMRYCDDIGICTDEYFYIYAYQYVKFKNSKLQRYRNRFNFRGFMLGEEDDYVFANIVTENHLIYQGPDFDLAIPWNRNQAIYQVDKKSNEWTVLCP